jgi:hypothetical protein
VHWSETASERVAKVARRSLDGVQTIPLDLYEQKMDELKDAMRMESQTFLMSIPSQMALHEKCDRVQAAVLRDDTAAVFEAAVEYYKEHPSTDRALLFKDLSYVAAIAATGMSSRTLAKAKKRFREGEEPSAEGVKPRVRMSNAGYSTEEIIQIANVACLDKRFSEVHSWTVNIGGLQDTCFEAVALMDVKTIWETLCKEKGEKFCSLATFYRHLPPFFVEKKKERCVCGHCKTGRRYLQSVIVLLNALRQSKKCKDGTSEDLDSARRDFVLLLGHLEKEIVIEIVAGRHECTVERCQKCGLLRSIMDRLLVAVRELNGKQQLLIKPENWSSVFPGKELPAEPAGRYSMLLEHLGQWKSETDTYLKHLMLKADRIRTLEADISHLRNHPTAEVWLMDYMMSIKLKGTFEETESDFLSKASANNLGFLRVYWHEGELWKEYWVFIFEDSKDSQSTMQIQRLFLQYVNEQRKERRMQKLASFTIWADNAGDLKGGDGWNQWQKEIQNATGGLSRIVLNYHAPNEGKTELDGHFGTLSSRVKRRERQKLDRSCVADLLVTFSEVAATHVVHVELDRSSEARFYKSSKGISQFHSVEITAATMKGQTDSKAAKKNIVLNEVRERKTKQARKIRKQMERQENGGPVSLEDCQVCRHSMKKHEDADEWIQCNGCSRSWHKTCVGIAADTPLEQVQWEKCTQCGGADPTGEMLQKRRKPPTCTACGKRIGRADHSACKQVRVSEANSYRTPMARVVDRQESIVSRKKYVERRHTRSKRKSRKRHKRQGRSVSPAQLQAHLALL